MSKGLGIIRRCKALVLAAGLIVAIAPATASAADFSVNDDGLGTGPPGANCAAAGFTTVAAAVAAAAANGTPGDRVLVCSGLYVQGASVTVAEALQILGPKAGVDARTRLNTGEAIVQLAGAAPSALALNTTATVDGFTFLANPAGSAAIAATTAAATKVVQNNIFDQNETALRGVFGNNSVFRQNFVTDSTFRGVDIRTESQSGIQITDNRFLNTAAQDIIFGNEATPGVPMTNAVIARNVRSGGSNNFVVLINADNTTLSGNTVSGTSILSGAGVYIAGDSDGTSVTGNAFTGSFAGVELTDPYVGFGPNDNTTVTGNTMLNNAHSVIVSASGTGVVPVEVHFNRFEGNAQGLVTVSGSGGPVIATNNWFGCNSGPGTAGCDPVTASPTGGAITATPWLILALSANPASFELSGSSALGASLTGNSAGAQVGPGFPDGTSIAFATDFGTITPTAATSGGVASATLTAGALGTANVTSTLDGQTVGATATVTPDNVNVTSGGAKKCKKKKASPAAKKKKCKKKKKKTP